MLTAHRQTVDGGQWAPPAKVKPLALWAKVVTDRNQQDVLCRKLFQQRKVGVDCGSVVFASRIL